MNIFAKCHHPPGCPHAWHRREEIANSLTHFIAALLSIAALVLLVIEAARFGSARGVVGCAIFGTTLILAYLSSAEYHFVSNLRTKHHMRTIDHISIYLLIAGTYTPFTLVSLYGPWGWSLFGIIWGLALIGIVFKLWHLDTLEWLSTLTYVLMGWVVLIAIVPIVHTLPSSAIFWLLLGGIFYTVGVFFFLLETIPYAHTVWHLFVIAGSVCHFFAVYWYVAPVVN